MSADAGGGAPDMDLVRAARANIRYHLRYIGYLTAQRNWLAGDRLTYADLAAAAHISVADFWAMCHGTRTKRRSTGTRG